MSFLIVFLGGGLGSMGRHGFNIIAAWLFGTRYPLGTLLINVLGSFAMGLVVELLALRFNLSQPTRLFLTTGIIGGFTTFSTFSLETATLYERGEPLAAAAYIAASVVLGIGALFAALWIVRVSGP